MAAATGRGTTEFNREQILLDGFLKHREAGSLVTRVSEIILLRERDCSSITCNCNDYSSNELIKGIIIYYLTNELIDCIIPAM